MIRRKVLSVVLTALTFGAGLGVGMYWGWHTGWQEGAQSAKELISPLALSQAGLYALTQYMLADDWAAEEALHEYLAFLDDQHVKRGNASTDRSYAFDTTVALTRLANVRLRSGDERGARDYLDRALRRCMEAGWNDECTASGLRTSVDRLDRSTLLYQIKHPEEPTASPPKHGIQPGAQDDSRG